MEGEKLYQYEFKVGMTCGGCVNAINKILGNEGYIKKIETSVPD